LLELGGSNAAANLWPQLKSAALRKDRVEDSLHARVCSGGVDLATAQASIAAAWHTAPDTATTTTTTTTTTAPPPPPTEPPATEPAPAPQPSPDCNPNYDPCVPNASDADCAGGSGNGPVYVTGTVRVIGTDVYGLDADGDGYGCD
jgi:hypothetical protein